MTVKGRQYGRNKGVFYNRAIRCYEVGWQLLLSVKKPRYGAIQNRRIYTTFNNLSVIFLDSYITNVVYLIYDNNL